MHFMIAARIHALLHRILRERGRGVMLLLL